MPRMLSGHIQGQTLKMLQTIAEGILETELHRLLCHLHGGRAGRRRRVTLSLSMLLEDMIRDFISKAGRETRSNSTFDAMKKIMSLMSRGYGFH